MTYLKLYIYNIYNICISVLHINKHFPCITVISFIFFFLGVTIHLDSTEVKQQQK